MQRTELDIGILSENRVIIYIPKEVIHWKYGFLRSEGFGDMEYFLFERQHMIKRWTFSYVGGVTEEECEENIKKLDVQRKADLYRAMKVYDIKIIKKF